MKDKILLFIIGVLVGAIIATGAFYAYTKATTTCDNQMHGGNPPDMQNRQFGQPPENNSEAINN